MAHVARRNFIYRVEAITPTFRSSIPFRHFDRLRHTPGDQSGSLRKFWVRRDGADAEDLAGTNLSSRKALHRYTLEVFYPNSMGLEDLEEAVSSDRHDIIKALRSPAQYVGVSGAPSTATGILHRYREADEMIEPEETNNIQALALRYAVLLQEAE